MEGFHYVDLFATKGIEYLFVIAFLLTLILFWGLLNRTGRARRRAATATPGRGTGNPWFELRRGLYYHQGHTWALPDEGDTVKIGVDDFAQKLVGVPDKLEIPAVGERIGQGESGWRLKIGTEEIEMLSPVDGEIMEINEALRESPHLINEDPYGKGWLMRVRVPRLKANLKNLITDRLARTWMEDTVDALRHRMAEEYGPLALQDGGVPVTGMGRYLSGDRIAEVAAEFLSTK